MQTLILVRGLPGSGKSTLASKLASKTTLHYETDMFFYINHMYRFDPSKLGAAHSWCKERVEWSLKEGFSVVVSNTFTTLWEMEDYVSMIENTPIQLQIIECKGQFGNIHNVPYATLKRMAERWENIP